MRALVVAAEVVLVCVTLCNSRGLADEVAAPPAVVAPEPQIMLQVQMLQLDRTLLGEIPGEVDDAGRLVRLQALETIVPRNIDGSVIVPRRDALVASTLSDENTLNEIVDAWRRQGDVLTTIAAPTIVTVAGRPASIVSGGTVKVPVPQPLGRVGWEQRPYGTAVDFRATIDERGVVHLNAFCRHSHLDSKHNVTINGYTLPGLIVDFEGNVTAELRSGQTLLVSGMRRTADNNGRLHKIENILILKPTVFEPDADVSQASATLPAPRANSPQTAEASPIPSAATPRRRLLRNVWR
jgi:Flp pilus assembly secretin CpaC